MLERERFLQAIETNPRDLDTRKIFADWLDEYGTEFDVELAQEHREWTLEKQDAKEWITEFGQSETGLDYADFIAATKRYLQEGDSVNSVDLFPTERIYADAAEFWDKFELLTGINNEGDRRCDDFIVCQC